MISESFPVCVDLGGASGASALALTIGYRSRTVQGKRNEDCYGIVTAREEPAAIDRGVLLAVADGVSAGSGGRLASETTIRTVLRDYYCTPAHWSASMALDRVLRSVNDWLLVENSRHPELEGAVTTLSMLLLKDARYCLVHVGDTRVYRHRGALTEQLTRDHTWPRRDMRHVLKRAIGLDNYLVADFDDGELVPGDVYLLVTDGVWEVVGDRGIRTTLAAAADPQAIADQLTERSIRAQARYMGRNDATAVVAVVHAR